MSPAPQTSELADVIAAVSKEALAYLEGLDERPVRAEGADEALEAFAGSLPEDGDGSSQALELLFSNGVQAAVHSAGPRFFHFVIGGVTPASLGADWFASTLDQNSGLYMATPLGARLEAISLSWLRDLFALPSEWGGVLTSGATMANFVGLASARQWYGERLGVDVAQEGLAAVPQIQVFSSGYLHASAFKALAMMGIGRNSVKLLTRDDRGALDLGALERELTALKGHPSIVIGNAGEVNAGDFDPIGEMGQLAHRHGAWFHVDGAFGLFSRISDQTRALTEGIEQADSVISDGHKWLNVPYDCGFAFTAHPELLPKVFSVSAAYLVTGDAEHPDFGVLGPESSRRSRGIPVWATLKAYGRGGYRAIVERHLELAQRLAGLVDEASDLTRLAEVPLNIVCFRYDPGDLSAEQLDDLNRRIGAAIIEDGRVFVGTSIFRGMVVFRPAIVNWRTSERDIDLLVEIVRDLGRQLHAKD